MSFSPPAATITSLDHLVLTVKSIAVSQDWYTKNLGMRHEAFISPSTPEITRHSLIFGNSKINLHESGKEFQPKAANVQPGSADLCFITLDNVADVRERLLAGNVELVDLGDEPSDNGVVIRTGAKGKIRSVYCRDPDGNLIEISNYTEM